MLAVVTIKELSFIKSYDDYKCFLPCPLAPSGGSLSIVAYALHLDKAIRNKVVHEYILQFSEQYNIPSMVYENILRKFHVALGKKCYREID